MSSNGPMFPKKSETGGSTEPAPQIEIERSDDGSLGKTSRTSGGTLPTMKGKQIGCGTSVFALMLLVAIVLVGRTVL